MAEITVPWGGEEMRIALPKRWVVQHVANLDVKPASPDWPERLAVALDQPGTGQPLSKLLQSRRNGRIVVVVEDVTRRGPLARILEILMREIRFARIANEQIEVVFATGMHPPMAAKQVADKLGLSGESIRWRCNPCRDRSACVRIGQIGKVGVRVDRGVAEADLRLIVSSVSP